MLLIVLILGMSASALASDDENTSDATIDYLTAEEYIAIYAENRGISYTEAEMEVLADNQRVITEYCIQNNILMPLSIDFYNGYPEGDVWIYYADVYDTYDDGAVEVEYHTYGRVMHDAHSDVFLGDSDDWRDDTQIFLSSGSFTFENGDVYVNLEAPTAIFVRLTGTLQIEIEEAIDIGFTVAELIDLGYTQSGNYYLRSSVRDSFRETL